MSIFKNVSVVEYHVKDWEKAKKFYKEVLEWPVCWSDDSIGWYEYGRDNETHIAISRWQEGQPLPGTGGEAIAVFTVDDAVSATEYLRARKVKCDDAVNVPGVVCYGTFYDPEGNRFQFASEAKK
jgi:predicted enzyme related to lactoylglutathione lyase